MFYFTRLVVVLFVFAWAIAHAEESTPLTIITLSGVGSQSDGAARFFAPLLSEELKQPVVVANYPGGNGAIGMKKYVSLPADCNSLFIGHSTNAYVAKFMTGLDFNPLTEFTPLHGMANSPAMILVGADSSIFTVRDLVNKYRTTGRITGTSTIPTTAISMNLFDQMAHVKTDVVGYKNATQAALDIAAGLVDYTISAAGNIAYQGLIDNHKIRVIAAVADERSTYYPTIKTLKEQGYKAVDGFVWNGFFIHAKASEECKIHMTAALQKMMRSPEAAKYSERAGFPQRYLASGKSIEKTLQREYDAMTLPIE